MSSSSLCHHTYENLIGRERNCHVIVRFSLKCLKQQHWQYLAGQLRVWQNYFHRIWIFIADRTQMAVKSVDGHRPWLLSECELPKPDCCCPTLRQRQCRPALSSEALWQGLIQKMSASLQTLRAAQPHYARNPWACASILLFVIAW